MPLEGASEACLSLRCNPKPLSFWFIKWQGLKNEDFCSHHPVCSVNSICETWCLVSKWDLFLSTPLESRDVTSLLLTHTFPWLFCLEMHFSVSQFWLFILCLLWNKFPPCISLEHWNKHLLIFKGQACKGLHLTSSGCWRYRCASLPHSFSSLSDCSLVSSSKGVGTGPIWQRGSED